MVRVSGSTLTARGAGECIVTVASESNPEVSVDYRVIVITPVTGVTVTADTKTLFIGHNGAADRDGEADGRIHHGREVGEHERESRRCG